jgi:hypothetical protein
LLVNPSEKERKIDTLREVEIIADAVADDDCLIGATDQLSAGMDQVIDRPRAGNFMGGFHRGSLRLP